MANKHSGFLSLGDLVPNADAVQVLGVDALNWLGANLNSITFTNNSGGTTHGKLQIIDRSGNVALVTITNDGNVGIATTSPTARLHLPAGTTSPNTGPLKFTQGTNTTIAEPGAVEYDGLLLYLTINGPTRKTIAFTSDIPTTASGVYTPTLTNVANLDGSQSYECQYLRLGSVVTVSGKVDIDPTLTSTSTQLGISLPIASNFGAYEDCTGVAFCQTVAGQGAAILADFTNDRAQLQYISGDTTNVGMYFIFQYQII